MRRHRRLLAAALTSVALTATGCTGEFSGIHDLPLPGGADLGEHPYRVTVRFKDVLDLVPQAGVKVNDVPVGRVENIGLAADGWTAEVTVAVNGDVVLPADAVARLRQSSLLGEKYVELATPATAPDATASGDTGRLADGAVIPVERTNRNPEVEEVFGALSLLLNGGGIGQIQDITKELNKALDGNEPEARALLTNLNTLVTSLDAHRGDITRALDGVNRLAATLNGQRERIGDVLTNLGPGLDVLSQQRGALVSMLQSLDTLSGVAVDTVHKSQQDLVADLRALTPTLRQLAAAGQNLPNAFELLLTYPFTDAAANGVKGDYTNLYANLDLDLGHILDNLSRAGTGALPDLSSVVPAVPGLTGPPSGQNPPGGQPNPSILPLPSIGAPATSTPQPGGAQAGSTQSGGTQVGGLAALLGSLLGGGG
ncbi:MCE family protein [Goodfellowiella coeruleoviolacea]|uniref:Phospholipid/cholesterol/gamma-HCH transport system substrate-binding protein n=1 Tax=Goodfellowiella coeruleoviolacea TaxID=334858 RepID=A0AAE3KKA7_9PSEU|nr:MCE family protein [Goodfellowiella coeruleoviolacea]MCP2170510.1 phospholipid/cholesterol/gamma-HCH transport system substrate-binding protein [Goodfellowiella coeruleoviolacea]